MFECVEGDGWKSQQRRGKTLICLPKFYSSFVLSMHI